MLASLIVHILMAVAINNHSVGNPRPCTDGSTSCTWSSRVVSATGDAAAITVAYCPDVSCAESASSCTLTVTDGTNTYNRVTNAVNTPQSLVQQIPFVATNATSGTYTLTFSTSGTTTPGGLACKLYYLDPFWQDMTGADTSTPVDSNVSTTASNVSTSNPTVTSSGNVARSGEVAISVANCFNDSTLSASGSFSLLDASSDPASASLDLVGPTSGSTTTASGTCATGSGGWSITVFSIQPPAGGATPAVIHKPIRTAH